MTSKNLILIGGGGHCKSVIEVAESAGYTINGILDLPNKIGNIILGYPIIGTDDNIKELVKDNLFIVTVGHIMDADLRIYLHKKINELKGSLATLIAKTAYVSSRAVIGKGTVIMHHAMVNADVRIGEGCIINTHANIEHDSTIDDYCHISTGVMVNGNCKVGKETFIGSQTVLVNGLEIASNCVIGAGSLVRKDIIHKGIYSGNPAVLKITRS